MALQTFFTPRSVPSWSKSSLSCSVKNAIIDGHPLTILLVRCENFSSTTPQNSPVWDRKARNYTASDRPDSYTQGKRVHGRRSQSLKLTDALGESSLWCAGAMCNLPAALHCSIDPSRTLKEHQPPWLVAVHFAIKSFSPRFAAYLEKRNTLQHAQVPFLFFYI